MLEAQFERAGAAISNDPFSRVVPDVSDASPPTTVTFAPARTG
jgi:hypothetical protein